MNKNMKWARGLPGGMINQIMALKPVQVYCEHVMPEYTEFTIKTTGEIGIGVSICSPIEVEEGDYGWEGDRKLFNAKKGKVQAAGRAIAALRKRRSSMPIRNQFPRKWTSAQVKRLQKMGFLYEFKSAHIVREAHYIIRGA